MQPDNQTSHPPDAEPANSSQPEDREIAEAINVVCDELFSSHMLGRAETNA